MIPTFVFSVRELGLGGDGSLTQLWGWHVCLALSPRSPCEPRHVTEGTRVLWACLFLGHLGLRNESLWPKQRKLISLQFWRLRSKLRGPAWSGSVSLPGVWTAVFGLSPNGQEKRALWSLLIKALIPSWGPIFMASSKPVFPQRHSLLNSIMLGLGFTT